MFLSAFMTTEEVLVFICTSISRVRWQLQLRTWRTAVCVTEDCSCENNKNVTFPFTCTCCYVPLFSIEWASKILLGHIVCICHTCPADNLEKKTIWIPDTLIQTLDSKHSIIFIMHWRLSYPHLHNSHDWQDHKKQTNRTISTSQRFSFTFVWLFLF